MTKKQPGSRELALQILYQVNEEGAYANLALDKALFPCTWLDPRDRGFITEIVYGSVKNRGKLDYVLNQFASTKVNKMDKWTRNLLRLSLYQILFLDKVPDSAAVNEAVKLAKHYGHVDKFVNAVLRNILRGMDGIQWPDKAKDPVQYLMVQYSFPQWMVERFIRQYGLEDAERLCDWYNQPAAMWIRTNTLKTTRAELKQILEKEGLTVSESRHTPEGLKIENAVNLHKLKSFQQGLFTVQDESSMLVALAAEPAPGQRVLDVCSAPGGKTTHMAQLMKNKGTIYACDIHKHRLDLIAENCKRLGISNVELVQQDGTKLTKRWQEPFDVVLCDVPCSGLGVLGRRADARWAKESEDIAGLCKIQKKILEEAAQLVVPGGTLIYSTCTIAPEENQEMVKAFISEHPEYELDETLTDCWLDVDKEETGYVQFLPFIDDMDGFFIARMMRREEA
ncbi:MAG: 16S rRNA (cytosine(967)-C(5))-methyltransferase RsmB [Peptococcaceae bacterium]|nr:16S rRNA (cytosine(967)-C(5))-methyltransferase RsmB [Peptococcaceae bacterium]MBQ2449676.1 16S rRNA (cytosine(967)-C(5))-methyltransferase RsmB [Peptococcaceae bacterium]MBQ5682446.1 16S rRNA (cytosine(967)-C(5))-methyltransferase RsmB [Peptococcaceae bacterium]MBQ5858844.1 16S rRNA (cytosine(967)-C(5))-methyltransferase RsmB [Peptococcaceae bacterium]